MQIRYFLAPVLLGLLIISQASQVYGKKPDLLKLETLYKNLGSIKAVFTQSVFQATLDRTKVSHGILYLQKPHKIRWEVQKPTKSLLVSNGKKVWYYSPAHSGKHKGEVSVHSADYLKNYVFLRILDGSIKLKEAFTIKKKVTNKNSYTLFLQPKKEMNGLLRLELTVNSKSLIEKLVLHQETGNQIKIALKNMKLNVNLPLTLFQFNPAKME